MDSRKPRSHRAILIASLLAGPGIPTAGHAIEFTFGYDGFPGEIRGSPGETVTFEAFITLTTRENDTDDGAQAWIVLPTVTGGEVASLDVSGINVSTVYRTPDGPPIDPSLLELSKADFVQTMVEVDERCPGSLLWVLAVALEIQAGQDRFLQPLGTQRIGRLQVRTRIPADGAEGRLSLDFDRSRCFIWSGSEPFKNVVIWRRESVLDIQLQPAEVRLTWSRFRRGDVNADGGVDISDPIALLGFLYLSNPAPGCLDASDANDNEEVDLTDVLSILFDLYSPYVESRLPAPGPYACGLDPTLGGPGCRESPACP